MRNPDGVHVLPGGRETLHAKLKRRVGEMIGCIHFHHLKSPVSSLPCPNFMQIVFLAGAVLAGAGLTGDYETDAAYRSVCEALRLDLAPGIRLRLAAALQLRGDG